jgi:hypothetical protein
MALQSGGKKASIFRKKGGKPEKKTGGFYGLS